MDRYEFVRDWFDSASCGIKKYTLKDAACDMRNIRREAQNNPEMTLPVGLSARYLYTTVNELIGKNQRG